MDTFDVKSQRTSLSTPTLRSLLDASGLAGCQLQVFEQVGSTNDVALEYLSGHSDSWLAVTANEQTTGRGRLERSWSSPVGASVSVSLAIPFLADQKFAHSFYPLVGGLAMVDSLSEFGVNPSLKWPNDIVIYDATTDELFKLGGVLTQLGSSGVVIGVGVNISLSREELPVENATSTSILGFDVNREKLIASFVGHAYNRMLQSDFDFLRDYRAKCSTISQQVRIELVSGLSLNGTCQAISDLGHLIVDTGEKLMEISSGDVQHVRRSANTNP